MLFYSALSQIFICHKTLQMSKAVCLIHKTLLMSRTISQTTTHTLERLVILCRPSSIEYQDPVELIKHISPSVHMCEPEKSEYLGKKTHPFNGFDGYGPALKACNTCMLTSVRFQNPLFSSLLWITVQTQPSFQSCLFLPPHFIWSGTRVFSLLGDSWWSRNVKHVPKTSPSRIHAHILVAEQTRRWPHTHQIQGSVINMQYKHRGLFNVALNCNTHTHTDYLNRDCVPALWQPICHFQGHDYQGRAQAQPVLRAKSITLLNPKALPAVYHYDYTSPWLHNILLLTYIYIQYTVHVVCI